MEKIISKIKNKEGFVVFVGMIAGSIIGTVVCSLFSIL